MGIVTKAFKSGNSVAVRLPKELGIVEGMEIEIERTGESVTMRPKPKRTMAELAARLLEIGPPPGPKVGRQKILFPKRPGL